MYNKSKSSRKGINTMKKATILFLTAVMLLALSGCGDKQNSSKENDASSYETALDVLQAVVDVYGQEELFAMYGGNQENAVMDGPGAFDLSKTEELETTLGLPADQIPQVEDAASMVHMMNANTFTGAAYRLKEGVDGNDFADTVKANILNTQWICGQPDTLLILQVDSNYIITAYGAADIIELYKNNALSALKGATVLIEASIA